LCNNIHLTECNEEVNNWASYYDYKYRMSLGINGFDALKEIYGNQYDGYIQPIQAPTVIFGGSFNHEEICIFKPTSHVEFQKVDDVLSGGKQNEKQNFVIPPNFICDIDNRFLDVKNMTPEILKEMNKKFCLSKTKTKIVLYPTGR